MKKILALVIISFSSLFVSCQTKPGFTNTLQIKYTHGDESHTSEEMSFEIHDNKVYGKITRPNADKLLSSEIILTSADIKTLNSFLELSEKFKNKCDEINSSSDVQYYSIFVDNKVVKIYECDWKVYSFFDIKQQIFGNYLQDLEKKKQILNNEISNLLIGNWKANVLLDDVSNKSEYIVEKLTTNPSSEYIEFIKDEKVILHKNGKAIYYNYRIDVLDGNKFLIMNGDDNKNGEEFVYGDKFLINSLSQNKIILTRSF